jgi:uncharacterized protein DUF4440
MKRIGPILALALAGAAPPAVCAAQVAPADSAALVAVTQSLLDAITSGDSSVWAPHLSPAWFITDEEGNRHTRAEFLAALRPLPPGQQGVLRLGERHLAGTGDVVVLSYAIEEEHDYYGQLLRTRFHATDTWVRRDGAWRMLASQVTALPSRVAGRRLPRRLLEEYAGTYALTDEITLEVTAGDDGLRLVRAPAPPDPLHALTESIFVRDGRRGFWLFERDEGGAVVRLVHWRDNNPVVWRRRGTTGAR